MTELDHWHPVLLSRELRHQPVGVTLCGRELVLFRSAHGIGALEDRCPHRRMRLSQGTIDGERLVCPYHGWSFDRRGEGSSPGNPRLKPCAVRFEAIERHNAIWVRNLDAATAFPPLESDSWNLASTLSYPVAAPIEIVLDNFVEVEHTPTVHAVLGYPLEALAEVTTRVEATDSSVRVYNEGRQKPLPRVLESLFRFQRGDLFVDDWTTYFSPVYTVYDQYLLAPDSREKRSDRLRIYVFFNPVRERETRLHVFVYSSSDSPGRFVLNRLAEHLMTLLVHIEIRRDKALVERLADSSPDLRGMQLGRFDKALGENRKRLDRLYRGRQS